MITSIRKRDGRVVPFDQEKIQQAVYKALKASGSAKGEETARGISQQVEAELENSENIGSVPTVEEVQDTVERKGLRPHRQGLHPLPRRAQPRARNEHPADEGL